MTWMPTVSGLPVDLVRPSAREVDFGEIAQPTSASPAKKAAMVRIRDAGLVFHGLRKNAVNTLLEVGCTEAEVSAIVEMSEQMVRHYARDVNKRILSRSGTAKMETGWSETRKRLFGKALDRPVSE